MHHICFRISPAQFALTTVISFAPVLSGGCDPESYDNGGSSSDSVIWEVQVSGAYEFSAVRTQASRDSTAHRGGSEQHWIRLELDDTLIDGGPIGESDCVRFSALVEGGEDEPMDQWTTIRAKVEIGERLYGNFGANETFEVLSGHEDDDRTHVEVHFTDHWYNWNSTGGTATSGATGTFKGTFVGADAPEKSIEITGSFSFEDGRD
jgi:hypothetical protein